MVGPGAARQSLSHWTSMSTAELHPAWANSRNNVVKEAGRKVRIGLPPRRNR